MLSHVVDDELLAAFREQIRAKVPHLRVEDGRVVNSTPLEDLTPVLIDCARDVFGLNLARNGLKVYGKFDSKIHGGSVKVRPAVSILEDALVSGALTKGQPIFEATSGNFGLALGALKQLDFEVVVLVSRRLQKGVVGLLQAEGVRMINLDIDICPAPRMKDDANVQIAKAVTVSVRQQLGDLGFPTEKFDAVSSAAEELLARQDAIALAKLLARAYEGYCPEQYENEANARVHETVTALELEQQLSSTGENFQEFDVICAFGTGGTAWGISRFIQRRYQKKGVRVVFPIEGQDVAGIRTKDKARGLDFYTPETYLGEHEVDYGEASKVFTYFNERGFDVGESGALALYASIQIVNFGLGRKMVVMIADGAAKYAKEVAPSSSRPNRKEQVTLAEAAARINEYARVVWAHSMFVPKEQGLDVLASSLGCERGTLNVAQAKDVQTILNGGAPSEEFGKLLPKDGRPILVVCMAGSTSLMLAKVLERRGVVAESLMGGITGLPASRVRQPFELVQMARG